MIGQRLPGASIPIDLDREEARELARHELMQPGYQRETAWPTRVLEWLLEQFNRLISGAAEHIPGGLAAVLIMMAVVAIAVVVILRTGPLARRRAHRDPIFAAHRQTAAEHRAAADEAASAADWTTAVLERFRAVVAALEERTIIEDRSGRTAGEVARTAGERLPAVTAEMTRGATLFDEVLYGGRPGTANDDATMRELDATVAAARPHVDTDRPLTPAVPR
ncbi:DUF4129 domain-containing protein [Phytoactinopolyspora limicola]|uniref:DUF4129 domain-containing protein n=1 Tax=Phytoactinopolyspora limicola TaxID=2715536 RepID=UPI00140A7045|nr:DUF4129 domain-containing protein [Phytoactinopolyspora limicola]